MEHLVYLWYSLELFSICIVIYYTYKYFFNRKRKLYNPYGYHLNNSNFDIDVKAMRKNELLKFIDITKDEKLKQIAKKRLSTF